MWLDAILAYEGHNGRLASELLGYDPRHQVRVSTIPRFTARSPVVRDNRAGPLVIRDAPAGSSTEVRD